jgi:hypothetical protein
MPDDLLDRPLDHLVGQPDLDAAWQRTDRRARRRRTGRRAGAGLVAIGLLATGLLISSHGDSGPDQTRVATEPDSSEEVGWTRLPDQPLTWPLDEATRMTSLGDRVQLQTRIPSGPVEVGADTATFDPSTGSWSTGYTGLPTSAGELWVGDRRIAEDRLAELGTTTLFELRSADGTMQGIARMPSDCSLQAWSGEQVFVLCESVGGPARLRALDPTSDVAFDRADPDAGDWRDLPPTPEPMHQVQALWAGERLFVLGRPSDAASTPTGSFAAAVYDPSTDRWDSLPSTPFEARSVRAAWTGADVLVLGDGRAISWVPDDGWTDLADPPPPEAEPGCAWLPRGAAGRPMVQSCRSVAELDEDGVWRDHPLPHDTTIVASTTTDDALYAVGADGSAWSYRPAPRASADTSSPTTEGGEVIDVGSAALDLPPGVEAGSVERHDGPGWIASVEIRRDSQQCWLRAGDDSEALAFVSWPWDVRFRDGHRQEVEQGWITGDPQWDEQNEGEPPAVPSGPYVIRWTWPDDEQTFQLSCSGEALASEVLPAIAPS